MTTFKPTRTREFVPEKMDFKNLVGRLGLRAKLIEENLALERRNKPMPLKDPHWWIKIDYHWVIAMDFAGEWRFQRMKGNFFDVVKEAPPQVRVVHILRSNGQYLRCYRRCFDFFRRDETFSILDFSQSDLKALWKELKKPLSQKVAA